MLISFTTCTPLAPHKLGTNQTANDVISRTSDIGRQRAHPQSLSLCLEYIDWIEYGKQTDDFKCRSPATDFRNWCTKKLSLGTSQLEKNNRMNRIWTQTNAVMILYLIDTVHLSMSDDTVHLYMSCDATCLYLGHNTSLVL